MGRTHIYTTQENRRRESPNGFSRIKRMFETHAIPVTEN
jgi:hypothetical protein